MGMLGFYLCGFAFMFGGMADSPTQRGGISTMGGYAGLNHELDDSHRAASPFGLLGWKGFMLQGAGYDTAAFALFLFQMVFMDTTATIPTGAAAERWKFSAFMIYGCCHRHDHVSDLRQLGLGRRLAVAPGRQLRPGPRACGFRRFLGRAHAGRCDRADLRLADRAALWQIRPGRKTGASYHCRTAFPW